MREIEGYVCIATPHDMTRKGELLFGPNTSQKTDLGAQIFRINGMTPFTERSQAEDAAEYLKLERNMTPVEIGEIQIGVAETETDFESLMGLTSLIVIEYFRQSDGGGVELRGAYVEGLPYSYPIPGAYLLENKFTTFPTYERAFYVKSEVERQAQNKATIASFNLTRLP